MGGLNDIMDLKTLQNMKYRAHKRYKNDKSDGFCRSDDRDITLAVFCPAGLPRAHTPHLREGSMEVYFKGPWYPKGFEE